MFTDIVTSLLAIITKNWDREKNKYILTQNRFRNGKYIETVKANKLYLQRFQTHWLGPFTAAQRSLVHMHCPTGMILYIQTWSAGTLIHMGHRPPVEVGLLCLHLNPPPIHNESIYTFDTHTQPPVMWNYAWHVARLWLYTPNVNGVQRLRGVTEVFYPRCIKCQYDKLIVKSV